MLRDVTCFALGALFAYSVVKFREGYLEEQRLIDFEEVPDWLHTESADLIEQQVVTDSNR